MTISPGPAESLSLTPEQTGQIPRRSHDGPIRLSSAQASLWYFCRHQGGNSVYTIPRIIEIEGPLDVERLRYALSRVLERHEALRTVFQERDGEPVQIVQPSAPVLLPVVDLAAFEVEAWLRRETARIIDPAVGPIFQATVAHLDDRKHVLVMLWHHIVSDQRSARILDDEIGKIYNGREPSEPAVQFGDYAEWESTRLQGRDSEKARAFWKAYLDGAPPLIDLAWDRIRPAEPSHQGRVQTLELDPALAAQIRAFGVARRVTLFPVFLAAWALLLSRYSDRGDLMVGVPVSGRDVPELERVIGYFVNMLPLRLDVKPAATFEDLVRDCWARFRKCSASALPFDAVLDAVRPERNRSYSPLVQTALNYLRDGGEALQLDEGTTTARIPIHNGRSLFDLTLTVLDRPPHLRCTLEYNAQLFDARTIGQMGGHFLRILREGAAPETVSLGAIRMLSAEDRHAALIGRNATAEPIDRNETVLTWFDRQATRRPDNAALRSGKVEWSYRELSAFAHRVCAALEGRGIQPGDVVAVNAVRSPETVGIILGIWKCAAVWLPIDPRWPAERAQFVIQDSAAKTVIDSAWRSGLAPAVSRTPAPLSPDSPAYILYTSGSTGQPKGVAIRHGSLLNCLLSLRRRPGFGEDDTLLSVTPLSFDISLCELFLPLISGARLILPSLEIATNARAVKRLLEENKEVTVMQATPVTWRSLIEEGWKGSVKLRAWCGGETMPPQLADSLLDRTAELWNLYGPTETTIWSTVHRVSRGESPVPIGRPIANTQCYVLDAGLQPVPDGVPGELFIGGAGVSPGYRGHAHAQDDSFPPNPFVPGGRMYRTGDVVLWSPSSDLIFLHRKDTQVKLRGHRIELGEVESALSMLPAIRQAVVGVRGEALVAWVASMDRAQWDPEKFRAQLRARLPEYMVPSVFVPVDGMPLNSSGKVDPNKLPWPPPRADHAAPAVEEDPIAQALRALWEELLDVRPIGPEDNFFELGGHSLLAAKLFGRIEKVFGKRLPDAVLFQAPTIAGLSAALRARDGGDYSSLVPIQPLGDRPPVFCVPGAGGSILEFRELGRCLGPDQPAYALQPAGWDKTAPPHIRVEGMAAHYLRDIRALQPEGPYYLCGNCLGGLVALEMARQLTADGAPVALLAIIDGAVDTRKANVRRNRDSAGGKPPNVLARFWRRWSLLIAKAVYKAHYALPIPMPAGLYSSFLVDLMAAKRYKPHPCSNAVALFKTAATEVSTGDSSLGWAAIAPHGFEMESIPGDHFTALTQPHVNVLAARLKHRLCIAQAGPSRNGPEEPL